jgi:phosphomannomutase
VLDAGVVPSPLLAYASSICSMPGAMITASHNPPLDNGIKLFDSGYEVGRETEMSIERFALSDESLPPRATMSKACPLDVVPSYIRHVHSYARKLFPETDLSGISIFLDGGNGVGTHVLASLLGVLGASVHSCNSHATGLFPGRPSEPSPENLVASLDLARELGVDLIFAQDGDADRLSVFDKAGNVVPEDTLLAAFARHYAHEGDCVVLSIDTSFRTDKVLSQRGIPVHRVPLGYLHDGVRTYSPSFAGEPWKHIHVQSGPWIDGIMSGVILSLAVATDGWDTFFGGIPSYPYRKRAIALSLGTSARTVAERVRDAVAGSGDIQSIDETSGIRVNFADGSWVLVRPSGTEPKLRIIVEGTSQNRFKELENAVDSIIGDL